MAPKKDPTIPTKKAFINCASQRKKTINDKCWDLVEYSSTMMKATSPQEKYNHVHNQEVFLVTISPFGMVSHLASNLFANDPLLAELVGKMIAACKIAFRAQKTRHNAGDSVSHVRDAVSAATEPAKKKRKTTEQVKAPCAGGSDPSLHQQDATAKRGEESNGLAMEADRPEVNDMLAEMKQFNQSSRSIARQPAGVSVPGGGVPARQPAAARRPETACLPASLPHGVPARRPATARRPASPAHSMPATASLAASLADGMPATASLPASLADGAPRKKRQRLPQLLYPDSPPKSSSQDDDPRAEMDGALDDGIEWHQQAPAQVMPAQELQAVPSATGTEHGEHERLAQGPLPATQQAPVAEAQELWRMHRGSNIELTPREVDRFLPGKYFDDNVVDLNSALLQERDKRLRQAVEDVGQPPTCHFFPSAFIQQLYMGRKGQAFCYRNVSRWTGPTKLHKYGQLSNCVLDCKLIFVPICWPAPDGLEEGHWCLLVIDMHLHVLRYYDSCQGHDRADLQDLRKYVLKWLQAEAKHKKREWLVPASEWGFECPTDIPKQGNTVDCGVFVCMYARYLSSVRVMDFSQADMNRFRAQLKSDLLKQEVH